MVGAAQTTTAWCSTDSACSSGLMLQTCSSGQPPAAFEEVTAARQVAVVVKTAAIPDQLLHTEVQGFLQGGSGEEDDEDEALAQQGGTPAAHALEAGGAQVAPRGKQASSSGPLLQQKMQHSS